MPIQLKPEVKLNVSDNIQLILPIIEKAYARYGLPLVITSANDGQHRQDSLHYSGNAIDFRSKGIPASVKQSIYAYLKSVLSQDWELFFEFPGQINEHFHLEFDPKGSFLVSQFYPGQSSGYQPETYDPEAGKIPITAPLPGGITEPILAGEISSNDILYWSLAVLFIVLVFAAQR